MIEEELGAANMPLPIPFAAMSTAKAQYGKSTGSRIFAREFMIASIIWIRRSGIAKLAVKRWSLLYPFFFYRWPIAAVSRSDVEIPPPLAADSR